MEYYNADGEVLIVNRTNGDWTPEGGTGGTAYVAHAHLLSKSTIQMIERLLMSKKAAIVELQDNGSIIVKEYSK